MSLSFKKSSPGISNKLLKVVSKNLGGILKAETLTFQPISPVSPPDSPESPLAPPSDTNYNGPDFILDMNIETGN